MSSSELSEKNYRRICFINWALCVPLLLIFAWPYFLLCELYSVERVVTYPGAIIFAMPFMLTILHGHVTMALGAVHRYHFYRWLEEHPYTYGLLFYPMITSTRFRLLLLVLSGLILAVGFVFG